ncbi:MAG TPA: hypothetical protein VFI11_09120, partial [Anaerolineales bacterium]|nr:hypothetical protein [Anaerolineales bacterium]
MRSTSERNLLPVLALPAAVLLAVGHLVWIIVGGEAYQRAAYALVVILIEQGLAGMAALLSARKLQGTPASRSWRILAAAWLLWGAASSLNWGTWMLQGRMPGTPSMVDLLHLAGSLPFVWALATYPVNPPERFGRLRELLDVLVLTLAVLTLAWLSLLRPVLRVLSTESALVFWAGVRPVVAAVGPVLALRVILLAGPRRETRPLLLLGASAGMSLAASLAWAYWSMTDGYVPGGFADLLPVGAGILATTAAFLVRAPDHSSTEETGSFRSHRLEALLPIAFTYAVVGFTILDASLTGSVDAGGLTSSVALSVLLVARQGVVAGQNEMRQYASLLNASG